MTEERGMGLSSAAPGGPHDNFSPGANEHDDYKSIMNCNTSISTPSTGTPRGYNIRQNACYNYNDYNYNGYNYNESSYNNIGSRTPVAPMEMEVPRKTVVVSAGIPHDLFAKLSEREKITGRSRSEIIKEALSLYLNGDPQITDVPPPRPSLSSQLQASKSREELQDLLKSLTNTLLAVRDGMCEPLWVKEWYPRWNKRLISAVQKLEPMDDFQERLVRVMSSIAKELRNIDPRSEEAYGRTKSLLEQLMEARP